MVIYGINPVAEAVNSNYPIEKLLVENKRLNKRLEQIVKVARTRGIKVERVSELVLRNYARQRKHQGIVAVIEPFKSFDLDLLTADRWQIIVVCDHIQDPRNLGAVIRSAVAFSGTAVVIPRDRSSPITPVVVKASAGAVFKIPVVQVVNIARTIDELKSRGFWTFYLDANGTQSIFDYDFSQPTVVVVGSEGKGVSELVRKKCDGSLKIPISNIDSLNASVSAGIVFYERYRQMVGAGVEQI